ncbi:MAG TPA: NYN domain-containing protein, partial [Planctomycetota bacterium]|nr:NYN domain-containing protein [Planctomycetota bacterium]
QIILVFDGKEGVYSKRRPKPGFRVVFSRPPRSADDVILDFCREREARDKVRVVTSDFRDIASRASGLRFVPVTSEEFAQEVDRVLALSRGGGSDRTPDEKPRRPSGRDTDLWLREFGMEEENGW